MRFLHKIPKQRNVLHEAILSPNSSHGSVQKFHGPIRSRSHSWRRFEALVRHACAPNKPLDWSVTLTGGLQVQPVLVVCRPLQGACMEVVLTSSPCRGLCGSMHVRSRLLDVYCKPLRCSSAHARAWEVQQQQLQLGVCSSTALMRSVPHPSQPAEWSLQRSLIGLMEHITHCMVLMVRFCPCML